MLTIVLACTAILISAAPSRGASKNVARLNRGLAGTPLAGHGAILDREGKRRNVSPFFVASIAGVESSFGAAACGGNAWGIGSCSMTFASFAGGIVYTTRLLRTGYIDRGLRDVWSIGRVYCPPCGSRWGDKVAFFMRSRFRVGPSVTYSVAG
jgi:hypothetical protein